MNTHKFYRSLLLVMMTLMASVGCKPTANPEKQPSISLSSMTFNAAGGSEKFTVSCEQSWTASADVDWLKVSPSSGTGEATVTVTASSHVDDNERKGVVKVTMGSVTSKIDVTQNGIANIDKDRNALLKIYSAMGGNSSWSGWGTGNLSNWAGVTVRSGRVVELMLDDVRGITLKGELPAEIGDLTALHTLRLMGEGMVGKLPETLGNLKKLENLQIAETGIEGGIPDVFADMTDLTEVNIFENKRLTGTLPASLGSCKALKVVRMFSNAITGNVPEAWLDDCNFHIILYGNRLTGKLPQKFYTIPTFRNSFYDTIPQGDEEAGENYYLDLSDAPYLAVPVDDKNYLTFDGKLINTESIMSSSKYTIRLDWGATNPYGLTAMNEVSALYDKYHDQGLEIVTFCEWDYVYSNEAYVTKFIKDHGFDKLHNVNSFQSAASRYPTMVPAAEVYDSNGHLLFTYNYAGVDCPVPVGQTAIYDLVPFVSSLYGDFDPNYESKDFSKSGEVMTLQKASKGNGINIVLMGDAYVDKDMNPGGHYEQMMKSVMEEIFKIEPYKTFRDRFNVYAVKVVSLNCKIGTGYNTALSSSQESGRTLTGSVDNALYYAMMVPSIKSKENLTVVVMANNYCGGASNVNLYGYDSSVAFISTYCDQPELYGPIVRHEVAGHGFAHLADEYAEEEGSPSSDEINKMKDEWTGKGWWANVDFTNDKSKVKWADFLSNSDYSSTVGVYEGGATYTNGVYRPTEDSMMNEYGEYFNAPSRLAIYKRIMKLSGEPYSFSGFVAYDKANLAADKARK